LIFFVTFLHQGKKVNELYYVRNSINDRLN
jgi:hypothetical protein